jgi:glutamate/tyrosine decarboxylase-like PLP-dependent enzyme
MPYPAGAICFRDKRVRQLVTVEAPYIFHAEESEAGSIGRFILEGSKPGAAAAGVWMSHKVVPLDSEGYGRLITETAKGARALHRRLTEGDFSPFRLVPLPSSDINIVCFAVGHPTLTTLEATNAFVHRVHGAMSVQGDGAGRRPDYYLTQTVLRADQYGHAPDHLVEALGFTPADYLRAGGLAVLRCTVMDPFLASTQGKVEHIQGFAEALKSVMEAELRGESSR